MFHSPVNRSSQKHSVRHGGSAGNDDTRCPETSDAMFAQQPAVDGLGDEGQVSEAGGSQVQHRSHGLLAAAGTPRQLMSTTTRQWLVGICIEPAGCQFTNVNETVHQRLRAHRTVGWQIADVDFDLVLLFTCTELGYFGSDFLGCSLWSRSVMLTPTDIEHPRLINSEITFEEF